MPSILKRSRSTSDSDDEYEPPSARSRSTSDDDEPPSASEDSSVLSYDNDTYEQHPVLLLSTKIGVSGYRGVTIDGKKFKAKCVVNRKVVYVGAYHSAAAAGKAASDAEVRLKGPRFLCTAVNCNKIWFVKRSSPPFTQQPGSTWECPHCDPVPFADKNHPNPTTTTTNNAALTLAKSAKGSFGDGGNDL